MPAVAREILTYLTSQADHAGIAQVTIDEIAIAVESCHRTVQRYLTMLRVKHWLWVTYVKVAPKRNEPNVYRLLVNGDAFQRGETLTQYERPLSRPSGDSRKRDPRVKRDRPMDGTGQQDDTRAKGQAAGDGGGAPEENGNTMQPLSPQEGDKTSRSSPPTEVVSASDPSDEPELDLIGPAIRRPPPARPHVRPVRETYAEQIHALLVAYGFADVAQGGLAVRLARMFSGRGIHGVTSVEHLVSVLAAKRNDALLTVGDGASPWKGELDAQRAYVFVALRKMKLPELEPKQRSATSWRTLEERRGRVDAVPERAHVVPMAVIPSKTIASLIAQQIHDAIIATYHGVKPLKDLDAVVLANRLSHCCIESGGGGTLHVADIVATVKLFATFQAFRQQRNEFTPPAALESFFMAEMKKVTRGCAAEKEAQAAKAKPFGSNQNVSRQPGASLAHLNRKPKEMTPEDLKAMFEREEQEASKR